MLLVVFVLLWLLVRSGLGYSRPKDRAVVGPTPEGASVAGLTHGGWLFQVCFFDWYGSVMCMFSDMFPEKISLVIEYVIDALMHLASFHIPFFADEQSFFPHDLLCSGPMRSSVCMRPFQPFVEVEKAPRESNWSGKVWLMVFTVGSPCPNKAPWAFAGFLGPHKPIRWGDLQECGCTLRGASSDRWVKGKKNQTFFAFLWQKTHPEILGC